MTKQFQSGSTEVEFSRTKRGRHRFEATYLGTGASIASNPVGYKTEEEAVNAARDLFQRRFADVSEALASASGKIREAARKESRLLDKLAEADAARRLAESRESNMRASPSPWRWCSGGRLPSCSTSQASPSATIAVDAAILRGRRIPQQGPRLGRGQDRREGHSRRHQDRHRQHRSQRRARPAEPPLPPPVRAADRAHAHDPHGHRRRPVDTRAAARRGDPALLRRVGGRQPGGPRPVPLGGTSARA